MKVVVTMHQGDVLALSAVRTLALGVMGMIALCGSLALIFYRA